MPHSIEQQEEETGNKQLYSTPRWKNRINKTLQNSFLSKPQMSGLALVN